MEAKVTQNIPSRQPTVGFFLLFFLSSKTANNISNNNRIIFINMNFLHFLQTIFKYFSACDHIKINEN